MTDASSSRMFGIIDFPLKLYCSKNLLGKKFDIKVGDYSGKLYFSQLPIWEKNEENPLNKNLKAPEVAKDWKKSKHKIFWGRPVQYPSGKSQVNKLIFVFDLKNQGNLNTISKELYEDFPNWLDLFTTYAELISKQNLTIDTTIKSKTDRLDLFVFNEEGKANRTERVNDTIVLIMNTKDRSLKYKQMLKVCNLASSNKQPDLEYQVIHEAYKAKNRKDYRKAIIEAAIAAEIVLTNRIIEELDNIELGDRLKTKLLKKFRMLGGRFELIRLLDVQLPEKDYRKNLIEPRNDVIHRAEFPNKTTANIVISTVEELLDLYSPKLS